MMSLNTGQIKMIKQGYNLNVIQDVWSLNTGEIKITTQGSNIISYKTCGHLIQETAE